MNYQSSIHVLTILMRHARTSDQLHPEKQLKKDDQLYTDQ